MAGTPEITWSTRDEQGKFLDFSPDFGRVWAWKDELPEQRLVCVGKHVRNRSSLVSLDVLPLLCAARDEPPELSALEREIADFVADQGTCSTADLPGLIGQERKPVARAVERLQRYLILTTAGAQERDQGWAAVILDLLPRRYAARLRRLPDADDARVQLAELVLRSVREVSAADLAAVIGCRRKQAAEALERLVDDGRARPRDEEGFRLYVRRPARARARSRARASARRGC